MIADAPLLSPKTVLIVEDNALNLKLLYDVLEYHGYVLLTTKCGKEAVRIAREHKPDLILMDIQLPDITGIDAARELKADEHTRDIPIVAVTAFAMNGDRATILNSGCDEYVAKPFSLAEFLKLIARYTRRDDGDTDQGT